MTICKVASNSVMAADFNNLILSNQTGVVNREPPLFLFLRLKLKISYNSYFVLYANGGPKTDKEHWIPWMQKDRQTCFMFALIFHHGTMF